MVAYCSVDGPVAVAEAEVEPRGFDGLDSLHRYGRGQQTAT